MQISQLLLELDNVVREAYGLLCPMAFPLVVPTNDLHPNTFCLLTDLHYLTFLIRSLLSPLSLMTVGGGECVGGGG